MFRLTESKQIKLKKKCTYFFRAIIFQKLSCFSSKIIANLKNLLKNYERILIIPEEKETNLKKLIKTSYQKSFIFPVKCRVFWFFLIIQRRQKCLTLKVFKDPNSFTNCCALWYRKKWLKSPMAFYINKDLVSWFVPGNMIVDLKILGFCLT